MSFLESIQTGINRAEDSERHLRAIDKFFERLNAELAAYPKAKLRVERVTSTVGALAIIGQQFSSKQPVEREYLNEDVLQLTVTTADFVNKHEISKWRQHIKGIPCTLKFEGQEYVCSSVEDLEQAVSELLSSVAVGKVISKL